MTLTGYRSSRAPFKCSSMQSSRKKSASVPVLFIQQEFASHSILGIPGPRESTVVKGGNVALTPFTNF